jgi:ubiquinone/menaquinone biosynthesis C-methylase UbiE
MEAQFIQIRDQQKEIWNRFSPGWKKWDDLTMDFLKPMGEEIIHILKPKNEDIVLDIASGTGEPGLSIAAQLRGGVVVIADLSDGMLNVARENAEKRRLKNLQFINCDVSELPFPDNSFDSVSCRFGFMFFPEMLLAAKEIVRVLKPGGRVAVAVWGLPRDNFWASATLDVINRNMQILPPPPLSPGLFRCSEKGLIASIFKQAGLDKIKETDVSGKLKMGTTEAYWNFMTDVVAPVVAALSKADEGMKEKIRSEVFSIVNEKYPYGEVAFESNALIVSGTK